MRVLDAQALAVEYPGGGTPVRALRGATIHVDSGEVIGVVGESGCGKSTLALALGLVLPPEARLTGQRLDLNGRPVLGLSDPALRPLRGASVAMIFQDPMTAFNPVLTIGVQLSDVQHRTALSPAARREKARAMLARVGLPASGQMLDRYMHELSGGMRQRVAIAAALLTGARLLVADEPTTALDVTMEAQIIHLFRALRDSDRALVVITHHLGLVGELCDRVYVMYAGEVVEEGPVDAIYHDPRHPYTAALIACDPAAGDARGGALPVIPGRPPDLSKPVAGCAFAPRCPLATDRCRSTPAPWVPLGPGRGARCHEVRR